MVSSDLSGHIALPSHLAGPDKQMYPTSCILLHANSLLPRHWSLSVKEYNMNTVLKHISQKVPPHPWKIVFKLFNHTSHHNRNNIMWSEIYLRVFWHLIGSNQFSIFEVMPIWLSTPQEMKVAVKPLRAMVISELLAHTQACHDQNTASSKLDLSGLIGSVKTLQGTVNLEMTKICPRICLWLNKTIGISFPYSYSSKQEQREDIISHAEMKRGTLKHQQTSLQLSNRELNSLKWV